MSYGSTLLLLLFLVLCFLLLLWFCIVVAVVFFVFFLLFLFYLLFRFRVRILVFVLVFYFCFYFCKRLTDNSPIVLSWAAKKQKIHPKTNHPGLSLNLNFVPCQGSVRPSISEGNSRRYQVGMSEDYFKICDKSK